MEYRVFGRIPRIHENMDYQESDPKLIGKGSIRMIRDPCVHLGYTHIICCMEDIALHTIGLDLNIPFIEEKLGLVIIQKCDCRPFGCEIVTGPVNNYQPVFHQACMITWHLDIH